MQSILLHGSKKLNLTLTDAQLDAFQKYSRELIAWNKRVNLTRIVAPNEIATKHFLDSLSVVQALPDMNSPISLIDVGTGPGFPGLPLKIALPHIRVTLVESTAKKTAFLNHVVDLLQLDGVSILTSRAEEVGRQVAHRANYDVAVARAVANLSTLVEYTLPLVRIGGVVIAQKGQSPVDEIESASNALQTLGGEVNQILSIDIPGLQEERHLVVIKKIKDTSQAYPRRPGLPRKKPL